MIAYVSQGKSYRESGKNTGGDLQENTMGNGITGACGCGLIWQGKRISPFHAR